jgi:diaminopimelate epimerase
MGVRFHKMHGLGNDFVVIDAREHAVAIRAQGARAIADRHTGVGCDQLILVGPSAVADVSMRIWNADGSEVDACGNATRCVGALLGQDCTIETGAGLLHASPHDGGATVDMGAPRFDWDAIPIAEPMDTLRLPLGWDDLEGPAAVNMGNPHLVFFVDDVDAVPLDRLGPLIETDPLFPERINVNIATVIASDRIRMRTWERGAGLTRACGTGACAVFAAARRTRRIPGDTARIDLPGGSLDMSIGDGGTILMSGPASHVFTGEFDADLLA